jgi:hypothetical protein
MSVLSEKLANGKPAFKDVTICLDGSLAGEREEAAKAVRVAQATDSERLASNGAAAAKKALKAVEARVKDAAITIRITAVSFGEYNKFIIQNPPRKGQDESFNPQTLFMFVARRTGKFVDDAGKLHDITDEEWDEIEASLTDGDHDRLAQAVVLVNRQDSMRGIDFLSDSSGTTGSFSENSEPLDPLVSLTDD